MPARSGSALAVGGWLGLGAALALGLGLLSLIEMLGWLRSPPLYQKDFLQEYVLARAIAEGSAPYQPVRVLAERYAGPLPQTVLAHPTPHPPTLGLLLLPLAALDYPTAAAVWLGLGLGALGLAVYLLARAAGAGWPAWWAAPIALALLAWGPVADDLRYGNVTLVLLAWLAGLWRADQADRPWLAGLCLGMALWVKPVVWPVLLWPALRRDGRMLAAALASGLAGYLAAGGIIGFDRLAIYLGQIVPTVSNLYQRHPANQSLWTLGRRLLITVPEVALAPLASPQPWVVLLLAGPPLLALLLAAWLSRPLMPSAWALGLLICASILVNPLAWPYSVALAAIPLVLVGQRLVQRGWPASETVAAGAVVALLLVPYTAWRWVADALPALAASGGADPPPIRLVMALLTFGPGLAVLALSGLVAVLGARASREGPPAS